MPLVLRQPPDDTTEQGSAVSAFKVNKLKLRCG